MPELYPGPSERGGSGREVFGRNRCRFRFDGIEEEAIEALYSAIDRLPAQSARIMRLVVKGDKNQEIADQLGISVNSVKTLKYNALNILRKELTGSLLLLLAWFEVQG